VIKAILIACLGSILVYAASQRRKVPGISALMAMLCVAGMIFVFFPALATDVAQLLGVGRGADLMLYFFIVLTLAIALNLHLKLRAAQETITELSRAIALMNYKRPRK
jgi:hypothetical protein